MVQPYRLTTTLTTPDTRRRLLQLVAAVPVAAGLRSVLAPEGVQGQGNGAIVGGNGG